jgi:hypothetical protein
MNARRLLQYLMQPQLPALLTPSSPHIAVAHLPLAQLFSQYGRSPNIADIAYSAYFPPPSYELPRHACRGKYRRTSVPAYQRRYWRRRDIHRMSAPNAGVRAGHASVETDTRRRPA